MLFGEGVSPWPAIIAAAESVGGVQHYLIEQEEGPAGEQMLRAEKCLANWKKLRADLRTEIEQEVRRSGGLFFQERHNDLLNS